MIVTVTPNPSLDRTVEIDALVRGDVLRARRASVEAGGKGVNISRALAANGIEHTRQWQSPANAPDIARAILAAGADPDATCDVYRGGDGTTPLCLLVSSGPPVLAGVQDALVEVLCKGGANPDGLGGYRPLWTAIVFCYSRSVDRLAACGASVDNVLFAAATGNLDLVKSYVAGGLENLASPPSAQRIGPTGPASSENASPRHTRVIVSSWRSNRLPRSP